MTPLENPKAFGMSNNIIGFIYLISSIILSLIILFTKFENLKKLGKKQILICFGVIFLFGIISITLSAIHFRYEEETNYNAAGNKLEPTLAMVTESLVFALSAILAISFYNTNTGTNTGTVRRPSTEGAFDSSKQLFCGAIILGASIGIAMYAKQTNIEEYYEYKNLDQL